jgi:aminopeptidase N
VSKLEELERATLLSDSYAALLANAIAWKDFYAVASGLGDQDEPNPWETVAAALDMVRRPLNETQRAKLRDQARILFAPQLARLGWDPKPGEGELAPQLRAIAISTLGVVGEDEDVQKEAVRRFEANDVNGDIAAAILRVVANLDRPGDYDTFLQRYREATTPQEEMRYQIGLWAFRDEAVALNAAERCLREFRNQDAPLILPALMRNEETGPAVWRFLTDNWDEAMKRIPSNYHARLAYSVYTFIKDPTFAAEVEAFHVAHPVPGGYPANVTQSLERLRVGLAFADVIRRQI